MPLSYEYIQFLNNKVLEYLPSNKTRHGDKWNFKCPICGDGKTGRKHRAWWYDKTASFYCWNECGGMSGIKFLEAVSGKEYAEIRREFTQLFLKSGVSSGLSSTYYIPEQEPSVFNLTSIVKPEWKGMLSEDARNYLKSRRVTESPFFHDDFYSFIATNGNEYILIDWMLNGIDAYFQLNDFKKHGSIKYIFPKDHKKIVYGLDNVDVSWKKVILFEGVYDSLFVKNGLALGTKAVTQYQLKLIKERFPHHEIVIAFDNDTAGIESTIRMIQQDNDVKFLKWFDKTTSEKDINELVLSTGNVNIFSDPAVLDKMIVSKLSMKMFLIQNGYWKGTEKKFAYGSSSLEARKISERGNWNIHSIKPF